MCFPFLSSLRLNGLWSQRPFHSTGSIPAIEQLIHQPISMWGTADLCPWQQLGECCISAREQPELFSLLRID